MYTPPAFREDNPEVLRAIMRAARLATLVTATDTGLQATPLPLLLEAGEGEHGVLYGHLAKANAQWTAAPIGEALAIFPGADAYVTPSWYATKQETGKVVPTWNYAAVHTYGRVEFITDEAWLLDAVTRLTKLHEESRATPWSVSDAPDAYIRAQLKGIVGVRIEITRLEGKLKMSQNRNPADRDGVAEGLAASSDAGDRLVAGMIPRG